MNISSHEPRRRRREAGWFEDRVGAASPSNLLGGRSDLPLWRSPSDRQERSAGEQAVAAADDVVVARIEDRLFLADRSEPEKERPAPPRWRQTHTRSRAARGVPSTDERAKRHPFGGAGDRKAAAWRARGSYGANLASTMSTLPAEVLTPVPTSRLPATSPPRSSCSTEPSLSDRASPGRRRLRSR